MSRRPAVENLGLPDIVDQIFQIGQRLQAIERRLSLLEPVIAGIDERLDDLETGGGGGPDPVPTYLTDFRNTVNNVYLGALLL